MLCGFAVGVVLMQPTNASNPALITIIVKRVFVFIDLFPLEQNLSSTRNLLYLVNIGKKVNLFKAALGAVAGVAVAMGVAVAAGVAVADVVPVLLLRSPI